MTIRTAILEARFLLGDRKLFDELVTRFDNDVVRNTAAAIRRRQARRARRPRAPQRTIALSGRAEREGRQRRIARPAHVVLDRQIRLPRARAGRADQARRLRQAGIPTVPALRGFPLVGALPHALSHGPRRGAAVVRHPARDRGAARLHRTSRPAGRRALHEALLPDRQGCRRPHGHPVRRTGRQPRQERSGAQPRDGAIAAGEAAQACRERRLHRRQEPHPARASQRASSAIRST